MPFKQEDLLQDCLEAATQSKVQCQRPTIGEKLAADFVGGDLDTGSAGQGAVAFDVVDFVHLEKHADAVGKILFLM